MLIYEKNAAIRLAADYPLRPFVMGSPFDTPLSCLVVRTGRVRAEQIMGMRDSYLGGILIHSRGLYQINPCDTCTPGQTNTGMLYEALLL